MNKDVGNLWEYPAEARVITTNGFVKNNGEAVMGRGCAREAAIKWPGLPRFLGTAIKVGGNHVYPWDIDDEIIITFPVKHHWREAADLALIVRSARELVKIVDQTGIRDVVLPRPGCGNGRLDWDEVAYEIEDILDNRFTAITFG